MAEPDPDLVVIGGGPAGSTAATVAARAGLRVLLLEAGRHPRTHVGESLLPGIIPILKDIGAFEAVDAAGFRRKTGSTHRNWGLTPQWDQWFIDGDVYEHAWMVDRSRFDAILFDTARRAGARVHEHAAVQSLKWEGEHLRGLVWRPRGADPRSARPRLVIDASGQRALVASDRDLAEPIEGLHHEALWAHYEGAGHLPPPRERQAFFVAEEHCWLWCFPLGGDRTSVGVVRLHKQQLDGTTRDYEAAIAASEALSRVLGPDARRVTPVRRERDWSYRVREVAGPGWIAVGDAAGFIDPVLSTGVHLAMHSGWHAGRCAADLLLRGQADAPSRYAAHHHELFGDLLRMVRFYYQRNLTADDYFWESKRILMPHERPLSPTKAFVMLTSGLVRNLALHEHDQDDRARQRSRSVDAKSPSLDGSEPDELGFLCIHLHHRIDDERSSLYVLVEPRDPAARALFRTRNWHINAIAPRHGNDPISVPAFGPPLRTLGRRLERLDTVDGEPLAAFWRRTRGQLLSALHSLPPAFSLVRVFGE